MNKLLQNKFVLIGGVAVVVIVLVIVSGFFLLAKKSPADSNNIQATPQQISIPTLSADSIGLTLIEGVPGKTVIAKVTKIDGIKAIDYEFSYVAKGNITRGVFGKIDVTKQPAKSEIDLGTCSSGTCKYDQDVTDIKIVLKITKNDGKVYQSQATLTPTSK
jgi:hypothetical protein